MKDKFTTGPWEVFGDWGIRAKKSERQLSENNCHATFEYNRPSSEQGFANAHLIAAAPDMYAMLKEISAFASFKPGDVDLQAIKVSIDKLTKQARGE